MTLFCSTIIPTIGRPSLNRTVESVLCQGLAEGGFEIIVVNDSGNPLPEAGWQQSERVQVIHTARRERSVARNTGAALARGQYLHFLDDDDWLVPDALQRLWALSRTTQAKWLYGSTQLVDRQNRPLIQLQHGLSGHCFMQAMAGEWIPLQSSLIERQTFLRVGGFNPLLSGPEDIDLLRRVLLEEEVAETPHIIAHVTMGEEGSTTDYRHHAQGSRWARERILDAPNVYRAMRLSSVTPVWQGRMLRVYLTSILWNFQHRRLFHAMSRACFALRCLADAGRGVASRDYWRAASRLYESPTFKRGFQAADVRLQAAEDWQTSAGAAESMMR